MLRLEGLQQYVAIRRSLLQLGKRRSRLELGGKMMYQNKGHSQLRKGRWSTSGAYYSVTLATLERQPLLTIPGTPHIIFECFEWLETDKRLEWICNHGYARSSPHRLPTAKQTDVTDAYPILQEIHSQTH